MLDKDCRSDLTVKVEGVNKYMAVPGVRGGEKGRADNRHSLAPVRKRSFSALAASICGFACAAYVSTPPRNPLIF